MSLLSHSKVTSPSSFPFQSRAWQAALSHLFPGLPAGASVAAFQGAPLPPPANGASALAGGRNAAVVSVQQGHAHRPTDAGFAERLSHLTSLDVPKRQWRQQKDTVKDEAELPAGYPEKLRQAAGAIYHSDRWHQEGFSTPSMYPQKQ